MPIIAHHPARGATWRTGYRKGEIAGHQQRVTSTFSINSAEAGTGTPMPTHCLEGPRPSSVKA